MRNKKEKNVIAIIIFAIFAAALMITFRAVFDEEKEYRHSVNTLKSVKRFSKDEDYRQKIKGAVGYLYIPNTSVDYPVMQSGTDKPDFYLNHNVYDQYNRYGTPYLAAYCDVAESDNLIIYGHNVNGQYMFGALMEYKNKNYYENHKYIYLTVQDRERQYKIISVLQVNKNQFQYWRFVNARNRTDYELFVSQARRRSIYQCDRTVECERQLITLSTCDDSGGDERFVIIGINCNE